MEKPSPADAWIAKALSEPSLTGKDAQDRLRDKDLAPLWTDNQALLLGAIGDNYQRLYVRFTSILKDPKDPKRYLVKGQTKVKSNLCDFSGTMVVETVRFLSPDAVASASVDFPEDVRADVSQRGVIVSKCVFDEDPTQKYAGRFEGRLLTRFYTDKKNNVRYDKLIEGDGFSNNQFVGTWTSSDKKVSKPCRWGEYRIPMADALDDGAGEFSPAEKFRKNGWETFGQDVPDWWK